MKNNHNIVNLFAALLIFFLAPTVSYAAFVLKGGFPSAKNTAYRLNINQSALNDFQGIQIARGTTDPHGNFTVTLNIESEQKVNLFIGSSFYILWLGNTGELTVQELQGELVFTGSFATENKVLLQGLLMQPNKVRGYLSYSKEQYAQHTKMIDSLENIRFDLVRQQRSKLSVAFINYAGQEIPNFSLYKKSQFAALHQLQKTIPNSYFDFWNSFKILPDNTQSASYQGNLLDYTEYLIKFKQTSGNQAQNITAQFELLDSLLAQRPHTRETVEGEYILFIIKYIDDKALITKLKSAYETSFKGSSYSALITKNRELKNARLLKTPAFALKNENGKTVNLESFRGKVIYIDFWGRWCKPCLKQMPNSRALKKQLADDRIVFLYINFNDSEEAWIKAIKDNQIDGINLKAEAKDEKYFNEVFGIGQGFPRYAVIDKEGRLVSSSAPAPDKEETFNYLTEVLSL